EKRPPSSVPAGNMILAVRFKSHKVGSTKGGRNGADQIHRWRLPCPGAPVPLGALPGEAVSAPDHGVLPMGRPLRSRKGAAKPRPDRLDGPIEIGRASCRERV